MRDIHKPKLPPIDYSPRPPMPGSLISRLHDRFQPEARVSRREALKASLASAAGLILSACSAGPSKSPSSGAPRVCVIGAGLAGLACASELAAVGYDVTVVEAKERVGGRVLSRRDLVKGKNVEAGGEMIGASHSMWAAYAKKFGLELFDVAEDEGVAPVRFEGKLLSAAEQVSLWKEFEAVLPAITEQALPVDAEAPWESPGAAELDVRTAAEAMDALEGGAAAKRELRRRLAADRGVALEKQSWLGNLAMVKAGGGGRFWTEGASLRCAGGNQQLARKLEESLGAGRVRLGAPAASVEATGSGVVVKLADLTRIEADWVVVAVAPGVWGRIRFDPALPAGFAPQMGVAVKFLAAVDARFWRGAGQSARARTDGPISETWDGTAGQKGEGACLTAYSGGPAAEACRAFGKDGRVKSYAAELAGLFPDYEKHFEKSLFMDWPSDAWTGGGTSFPAPGEIMRLGKVLSEGPGRVQFAGEHMCYGFVGTMEGALQSGVKAANRIAVADGVAR